VSWWTKTPHRRLLFDNIFKPAIFSNFEPALTYDIVVAINPRIAEAVLGEKPYAKIELAEMREFKIDATVFMHQRLCGRIRPGCQEKASMETLIGYIYGDQIQNITKRNMKERKKNVKSGLEELKQAGWIIKECNNETYSIKRPKTIEIE
jgi:hypothetical protein